ncbi:unnamed protein product [Toxocara canis]|uniref:Thyroglobulin type-1 domain-containing protein n=1 Tax=Toxocara canis TaxID=6265 RepID=A0A183V1F5_TOXCA|nr:unnamed protein product [Toxocara canis]
MTAPDVSNNARDQQTSRINASVREAFGERPQRPVERVDGELKKPVKPTQFFSMAKSEKRYKVSKQKVLDAGQTAIKNQRTIKLNADGSGVFCANTNRRCCRVQRRQCPNGAKPQLVTRWFRKSGDGTCRPYQYPYCGIEVEAIDRPIKYEENCLDVCFSIEEKRRHPLFDKYPVI